MHNLVKYIQCVDLESKTGYYLDLIRLETHIYQVLLDSVINTRWYI